MTLMLLLVVALVMAGMVRASLARSMHASRAVKALQLRWGQLSCQKAMFSQTETLFGPQPPNAQVRRTPILHTTAWIELGGMKFGMLLSDESTKINLNTLARQADLKTLDKQVKTILRRESGATVPVKLNPFEPAGVSAGGAMAMERYGHLQQAFDTTPKELVGTLHRPSAACRLFTCWGQGKLNFRRASQTALSVVCKGLLDEAQIKKLLAMRQEQPNASLYQVMLRLGVNHVTRGRLSMVLGEESECFSLWLAVDDGRRTRYRLVIASGHSQVDETDHGSSEQPSAALAATPAAVAPPATDPDLFAQEAADTYKLEDYRGPVNTPLSHKMQRVQEWNVAANKAKQTTTSRPQLNPDMLPGMDPQFIAKINSGEYVPPEGIEAFMAKLERIYPHLKQEQPEDLENAPLVDVPVIAEFEW